MSVQFGKCNFDGKPVDVEELKRARPLLAPYGPDGEGLVCRENFGVLYRAFHTTSESRREVQPHQCGSGAILTWDGRLDNREELIDQLGEQLRHEIFSTSTDVEIVAAAYERWGTDAFAKLIGDWALSIWEPKTRSLLLAKDFVGIRHLYYARERDEVTWCSILDPLVLLAGRSFEIEEEYIAGWLSFFPATHLTPYVGIHAVPPSSFVRINQHSLEVRSYWDFDPGKRICYASNAQYEEHFRFAFSRAIRRRLRSDTTVVAELSGGMDSSAIVCMADATSSESPYAPPLETVSHFDDREPNWNEKTFFTIVERKRDREGWHLDVSQRTFAGMCSLSDRFLSTPSTVGIGDQTMIALVQHMKAENGRVLLSGVGGDEVTGGIPSPIPEIQDLAVALRVRALAKALKVWALQKRKPWFHLGFTALRDFFPQRLCLVPKERRPASWVQRAFVKQYWRALTGYDSRVQWFGPLPSFQQNLSTLEALRRQFGATILPADPVYEKRYPFLDRDFLEFIYAVPRTQIVRAGQRRSLMRRALRGIVPAEILYRRNKAYVVRTPIQMILANAEAISDITTNLNGDTVEFISPAKFVETIERAQKGQEIHLVHFLRTYFMLLWLGELRKKGLLRNGNARSETSRRLSSRNMFSRETT